jgi:hypothetical protein
LIILHGVYKFRPQTVAYRNDFCLTCMKSRRALAVRSFYVVHFFFIPLLPLGFLKEWHCVACNSDPHVHPGTRKYFKWLGVAVLVVFAAVAWLVPDPDQYTWVSRTLLPVSYTQIRAHETGA